MSRTAELIIDGKSYTLPLVVGSENEVAIDIGELMEKTGAITLDFGYKNTGATKSAITFLDGDKGILRYRGYSIEELAEKSNFLEVSYLLLEGELPSKEQLEKFTARVRNHTMLHEDIKRFYSGFPKNAHPMAV